MEPSKKQPKKGPGPPPPFSCGGNGQPACPPINAVEDPDAPAYSRNDMLRHGHEAYQKGLKDAAHH